VPTLAIDKSFLDEYSVLEKRVQGLVKAAIDKFDDHTFAGAHLEKIHNSKDPRMRTIRIDVFWRGVVLAPESGSTYYLLKVLPHDKAISYARSHRVTVNHALGVIEVRNEDALSQVAPGLADAARMTEKRLFGHVSDANLIRLGVDAKILPVVRALTSDVELQALQTMLPQAQCDALFLLSDGTMSVEEVWQQVAEFAPSEPVDTRDLVAAMRRSPDLVVFVSGNADLERILSHPFAAWRVFLHPAQRKIAYTPSYAGPVQVTGGAGTGKTVTALHRAAFLAQRAAGDLFGSAGEGPSILLTTFTRNLAEALDSQFGLLVEDAEIRRQVEILNVDRLAYRLVERGRGTKPTVVQEKELKHMWSAAGREAGLRQSPASLIREWEQIILAQDIHTEVEYLGCRRTGQGTPLGREQRRGVWQAAQTVTRQLREHGMWTYLQLASEAAFLVRSSLETPYQHVIVDEAQDLHPARWRLLRTLAAAGSDDLFIVGDPNQRIYDNQGSLASLGISVRARSRRLTVSYRTTQEILSWAVPTLGVLPATGLDDEPDTLTGYRSPLHGYQPIVQGYGSVRGRTGAAGADVDVFRRGGARHRGGGAFVVVRGRGSRRAGPGRGAMRGASGQRPDGRGPNRDYARDEGPGVPVRSGDRSYFGRGAHGGHAVRGRRDDARARYAERTVPVVRGMYPRAGPAVRLVLR
jgi:hypothetical protein